MSHSAKIAKIDRVNYFIHPESDSVWSSDEDPEGEMFDPCVERTDKDGAERYADVYGIEIKHFRNGSQLS